jgi:hypothetical protein
MGWPDALDGKAPLMLYNVLYGNLSAVCVSASDRESLTLNRGGEYVD